ncbi:MAG TPA: extracellular solute-binding protein [Myxococcales bacterium]|nr:extracellular solute-binding protein [Myxococcales bacterium]
MNRLGGIAVLIALCVACSKPAPQQAPVEVQVSSDLNPALVDTALSQIARNGGPRGERVPGMHAGVSALPGPAGAPVGNGQRAEAPSAIGDVRWDTEPYGAIAAAANGELLPAPATAKDVPPLWKDPGGTWVAVGGRAVVLLSSSDHVKDRGAPARYTALTESWLKGKVALVAPTGGMALAHFAALYAAWGPERMEAWLRQLKANEPLIYSTDAEVRQAVMDGRAAVGMLSSDEAAKAAASAARVEILYPNQKSIGTFVWPTALSVPRSAGNPEAAKKLAERLADRSTEQLLVARVPGYLPLRADIPVPPGVSSASNLVVVSVDPAHIVAQIAQRKAALAAWTDSIPKPGARAAQVETR